jgi:hypothetical protein
MSDYNSVTDELLARILDAQLTTLEMTGKRSDDVAVQHNAGAGTRISFSSPYASDGIFTLMHECRDENGELVRSRKTNVDRTGFTCIPDEDCICTYQTALKV